MNEIVRLIIHSFGPLSEVDIVFDKYTLLTGKQASGKSTIAKLYSMFTWMEKGMVRGIVSDKYIMQYSRFQNKYCAYHRLETYFNKDTFISFYGLHYNFTYEKGKLKIDEIDHKITYNVAKVMYVPAERNYLSTTDNTSGLKNLPESLQTFLEEFDNAKLTLKNGYRLPINNMVFEYDALNKIPWLKGNDYEVRLSAASSGYQSVLPLTLVTKYLSDTVLDNAGKKDLDQQERQQIDKEVKKVMNDTTLSEDVKFAMLRSISSRFKYSRFVNIVEEPEQNLYPESQMNVLYDLLAYANCMEHNRLVLTTHSPYIVNYFTLAAKAYELYYRLPVTNALRGRVSEIVSEQSMVNPFKLHIYELKDGAAALLAMYDGLPSDDNFLNNQLALTNEMFDRLLEIEETFDNQE